MKYEVPEGVTTIWFDLGGVLLEIDPSRTRDALTRLLGSGTQSVRFDIHDQEDIFLDFERGTVSADRLRSHVRQQYGVQVSDDDFDQAWNQVLLDPFPWANEVVTRARQHYRVALLSNTNEIHHRAFAADMAPTFGLMEQLFMSYEMGFRKPEKEIFLLALGDMGLKPQQVLFIEDNLANAEAARGMGLHVYHLTQPQELSTFF